MDFGGLRQFPWRRGFYQAIGSTVQNEKKAAREDRPFGIEATGELVRLSTCRPCRQRRGLRRRRPSCLRP